MQLPNDISSLTQSLAKLPQQKLAQGASLLLLLYIASILAEITWSPLIPKQQIVFNGVNKTNTADQQNNDVQDISTIKMLNLFGQYNQKPSTTAVTQVQDAPETKLNLVLAGVVASDDPQTASAIIEKAGQQTTYGIGEQIDGTRAVLEKVYFDRVIIKQSGKLETLMLDGIKYNKNAATNRSVSIVSNQPQTVVPSGRSNNGRNVTVDQRDNRFLADRVNEIKRELEQDPGKIIDYLRISPKQVDGQIVGYILMPGKNPEFFTASGLKSGDVAVQMNGYDLTSPLDAAQALQALKTEPEVTLWVDRNGEVTEILFSIQN